MKSYLVCGPETKSAVTLPPFRSETKGRVGRLRDTNLHGENDHRETHDCSDAHCYDHRLGPVEAGDHTHHVGHAESQDGLETRQIRHINNDSDII